MELEEAEPRIVVACGAAAGLDPGQLDLVFGPAGGSGRTGGVWADCQGSGEAAEGGDGTTTSTG